MQVKMTEAGSESDNFGWLSDQIEALAKIQRFVTTVSYPNRFPFVFDILKPGTKDQTGMRHVLLVHGIGWQQLGARVCGKEGLNI